MVRVASEIISAKHHDIGLLKYVQVKGVEIVKTPEEQEMTEKIARAANELTKGKITACSRCFRVLWKNEMAYVTIDKRKEKVVICENCKKELEKWLNIS